MANSPETPMARKNVPGKAKPTPRPTRKAAQATKENGTAASPNQQVSAAAKAPLQPAVINSGMDLQAILRRMECLEYLGKERTQNQMLQKSVAELTAKTHDGDVDGVEEQEALEVKFAELEDRLRLEQEALTAEWETVAQLQEQLEHLEEGQAGGASETTDTLIPRPKGTAGTHWSIQEAMGLTGSGKKHGIYKGLVRQIRDLTLNARIQWDSRWSDIPAGDKAKLYQVARDKHPFLKRFINDWATAEIARQFIANKRKYHYANGWLTVPEKYAYLKDNASNRNPTASRKKRVDAVLAAKKKAKQNTRRHKPKRIEQENDVEDAQDAMDDGEDGEVEN